MLHFLAQEAYMPEPYITEVSHVHRKTNKQLVRAPDAKIQNELKQTQLSVYVNKWLGESGYK